MTHSLFLSCENTCFQKQHSQSIVPSSTQPSSFRRHRISHPRRLPAPAPAGGGRGVWPPLGNFAPPPSYDFIISKKELMSMSSVPQPQNRTLLCQSCTRSQNLQCLGHNTIHYISIDQPTAREEMASDMQWPPVPNIGPIFLANRTQYGRAYATVLRLSVVVSRRLYGMYCG